ncbi:MAG: hypothetical protein M3404_08735, partial [Actinomycetota bacterium]|nr:hypothetical protein [Actinomycetota bacterium]
MRAAKQRGATSATKDSGVLTGALGAAGALTGPGLAGAAGRGGRLKAMVPFDLRWRAEPRRSGRWGALANENWTAPARSAAPGVTGRFPTTASPSTHVPLRESRSPT